MVVLFVRRRKAPTWVTIGWRALVSTSVSFVSTSDDVSHQAPPKIGGGLFAAAASLSLSISLCAKPPTYTIYLYLPTQLSTYLGLHRESARGRGEGGRRSRGVAGALARNRRIVYLYLSLPAEVK